MSTKAIILIQAVEEVKQYAFDYPLEKQLKQLNDTAVFTLDSLSDRAIVTHVKKFLEENAVKVLILDTRITPTIGIGQSILNALIKTQRLELICLGNSTKVAPFLKLFKGKVFNTEEEVVAYLSSN